MAMNQLEKRIQKANLTYRKAKKALVQKIDTPIRLTNAGMIAATSTVDFVGVFPYTINPTTKVGRGIAFDAKECEQKTSFPLKNIHQHQLLYLELYEQLGGIAFFLIHFKKLDKDLAYVTPVNVVLKYWNDPTARKSIPLSDFKDEWKTPIDDYLSHFTG